MTALDLCYRVPAAGGTIRAEGDMLQLEAPEPLSEDLLREIKANKTELLKLLRCVVLFASHHCRKADFQDKPHQCSEFSRTPGDAA